MKESAVAKVIGKKRETKSWWMRLLREPIAEHYRLWYEQADPGSEIWPHPAQFIDSLVLKVRIASVRKVVDINHS